MLSKITTLNTTTWSISPYKVESQHFEPQYWQSQSKVIGKAQGRGTTWFINMDDTEMALRHYYRGGLFGKLVTDTFFYLGEKNYRPLKELEILQHLSDSGVHVPEPIGARVSKRCLGYSCDILTKKIKQASDLSELLKSKDLPKSSYKKIGYEIRKMHDAGVNHTDLNIHNILIDDAEKVWIIDFDKCYLQQGERWKQSNLDRLLRSFHKEESTFISPFNHQNRKALMSSYIDAAKS